MEQVFQHPQRPDHFDKFIKWINNGKNAGMNWLERYIDIRENPGMLLEDCNTVISLAYPYSSLKPSTTDGLTVSRYSEPDQEDYHQRLKTACNEIVRLLKAAFKDCRTRVCVDSAPILERSFAFSSGIGFIGKNNMLIIPGYGSYFYLAEILTTASFDFSKADPMENRCGSCTLCLDSCPKGALEKPFLLNSSKCLSYLTIEYKGDLNPGDGNKMGSCFFGCDRCQEVCPYNEKRGDSRVLLPSAKDFLMMDDNHFKEKFGKTAFERTGLKKIQNNIRLLMN